MIRRACHIAFWVAVFVSSSLPAQVSADATMRARIWQAIHDGLAAEENGDAPKVAAGALTYSATALTPTKALELSSFGWDPMLNCWTFRLRCREAGACVPFLVTAPGTTSGLPLGEITREQFVNRGLTSRQKTALRGAKPAQRQILLRGGEMANLVSKTGEVRVMVRVVCLEPGVLGQWIRVRNPESGRVFRARVEGEQLLVASSGRRP